MNRALMFLIVLALAVRWILSLPLLLLQSLPAREKPAPKSWAG